MSIFGKCLALSTTTVILCATGWYDRDTCSSPRLTHFWGKQRELIKSLCVVEKERVREGPGRG